MSQPIITIGKVDNIFSRQMHFEKAGDVELGHTHQFDHLTLLAYGSIRITIEGITTDFKAPHMIWVRKDKNHELVALEDNTLAYCIHALREDCPDILDDSMIPRTA